ncbi:hypothetical protein SDC9_205714 [bioreactor metagenome]|uniref:Uncharacterized protein n=1 Tax=bioreactor metagenome TaxID=1076179 RepID=A0A645J3P7_9ZZZZ
MEPKLLVDFYGVWRGVDRHFVCLAGCPRGKEERTPDTLPLKARFHEEEHDVAAATRRQHADKLVFDIGAVEHKGRDGIRVVQKCAERKDTLRLIIRGLKLHEHALHKRKRLR